jgi:hypothetical protein
MWLVNSLLTKMPQRLAAVNGDGDGASGPSAALSDESKDAAALHRRQAQAAVRNALIGGGINTLADMMQWRVRELLTLPHCGPTTIEALRRVVAEVMGARRAATRRVSVRWRRAGAVGHASEAGRQHAR